MSTHSRCQIVRVDFSFLKSQPETRTARRQHGAQSPTRRANTARRCSRLVEPLLARRATEAEETPVRSGVVGGNVDGVRTAVGVNVAWNTHGCSRASLSQRLPLCVAAAAQLGSIAAAWEVGLQREPAFICHNDSLCMSCLHVQCLPAMQDAVVD